MSLGNAMEGMDPRKFLGILKNKLVIIPSIPSIPSILSTLLNYIQYYILRVVIT